MPVSLRPDGTDFKNLHGFDQIELFDTTGQHYWKKDSAALNTFYRYRVDVNNSLLSELIHALDSLNKARNRNWEMILTIADNSHHPEFEQLLGFDMRGTLELVQKYKLTLEIEDPFTEWTKPPERYTNLGKTYRRYLGDRPFIIDINIVPVHPPDQKGYSVAQPTGTEINQLWKKQLIKVPGCVFIPSLPSFATIGRFFHLPWQPVLKFKRMAGIYLSTHRIP